MGKTDPNNQTATYIGQRNAIRARFLDKPLAIIRAALSDGMISGMVNELAAVIRLCMKPGQITDTRTFRELAAVLSASPYWRMAALLAL